jgi:signal transduction histidine kinase
MLGGFTLVFGFSYLLMRHILKPVKLLQQGVLQLSTGNMDHNIPVNRNDELGDLTRSFNNMTRRIREMIRARDQLLLDVSHELRSPLTRIRVALELLPHSQDRCSILEDISEIEKMITDILESERLKEGHGRLKIAVLDLVELIRNVAGEYATSIPAIRISAVAEKVMVNADEERIRILIKNILENSIKYSLPDSRPVEVSIKKDENAVSVLIQDDGSGIPAQDIPYLFEPFYRVDKSRSKKTGGYGLGLHLCKKIMDAHGGEIKIYNNPRRGITVQLKFFDSAG